MTTTLFLRRKYLNDTLALELRWLSNVNDGDGLFGQFRRDDRAVLGMNYEF